jgi:hypothetical protein
VLFHLFFFGLSVAGFALWAVPCVRTAPGAVRVVNPLTTWTIPAESLGSLREGFMFPRLDSGGRVIRLWGLERSVLDTMRGHIALPTAEPAATRSPDPEPRVSRTIAPALGVLVALWLAVSFAGILVAVG